MEAPGLQQGRARGALAWIDSRLHSLFSGFVSLPLVSVVRARGPRLPWDMPLVTPQPRTEDVGDTTDPEGGRAKVKGERQAGPAIVNEMAAVRRGVPNRPDGTRNQRRISLKSRVGLTAKRAPVLEDLRPVLAGARHASADPDSPLASYGPLGKRGTATACLWHGWFTEFADAMDLGYAAGTASSPEQRDQLLEQLGRHQAFASLPVRSSESHISPRVERGAHIEALMTRTLAQLARWKLESPLDDENDFPVACWYLRVCEHRSVEQIAEHWPRLVSAADTTASRRTIGGSWMWRGGLASPADYPNEKERGLRELHDALAGSVTAATSRPRKTGFIGREETLEELEAVLEQARRGEWRVVLVAGEHGVGKTRLSEELGARAASQGWTVVSGRCDVNLRSSYEPFAKALTEYVRTRPSEGLSVELGPLSGELTRLIPELRDRAPGLPAPLAADPHAGHDVERYRLFEAVRTMLAAASRARPLLLILEDLHWAEESTLGLLKYLSGARHPGALVMVGTYRRAVQTQIDLADLWTHDAVTRISLAGLSEVDAMALVSALAGKRFDRDGARALWRHTGGNPLFLREMVHHLLTTTEPDALVREQDVTAGGVPPSLRDMVAQRVGLLPPPTQDVLNRAAVIGSEFDLDVLARTLDMVETEALDALEEAAEAGLLTEVRGRDGTWRFEHSVFRDALYDRMPRDRRQHSHLAVLLAIEALRGDSSGAVAQLAYHSAEAGRLSDADRVTNYALRAARLAAMQLASEDAATHCSRALKALDSVPGRHEKQRCALLLELGEAQRRAGHGALAKATFQEAVPIARSLGDPALLADAALGAAAERAAGQIDQEQIAVLEEALEGLRPGDAPRRIRLLIARAQAVLYVPGSEEERESLCQEARRLASEAGDPILLAHALQASFFATLHTAGVDERLHLLETGRERAESAREPDLGLRMREWGVYGHVEKGDMREVACEVDGIAEEAEKLRQPWHQGFVLAHRALIAIAEGRFHEGEALATQAFVMGTRLGNPNADLTYFVQLGTIRREQGRLGEVVGQLRQMVDAYPDLPWRSGVALAYAELGQLEAARREFECLASGDFQDVPRDLNWLGVVALLAETAAELGGAGRAACLYGLLLPYADRAVPLGEGTACWGAVEHFLGRLAATMGRPEDAVGHLRRAWRFNRERGLRPYQARSACALGGVHLGDGHPEKARTALEEAIEIADELGMTPVRRSAGRLLRSC